MILFRCRGINLSKFHCIQLPNDVLETWALERISVPTFFHQFYIALWCFFRDWWAQIVVQNFNTYLKAGKI